MKALPASRRDSSIELIKFLRYLNTDEGDGTALSRPVAPRLRQCFINFYDVYPKRHEERDFLTGDQNRYLVQGT